MGAAPGSGAGSRARRARRMSGRPRRVARATALTTGRLRRVVAALALATGALALAGCGSDTGTVRTASASRLVSIGAGLRGPATLRASVYATGLSNVSAFALDGKGRLWATTSAASGHGADGVWLIARGRAPREGHLRPARAARADVGGERLYVASIGRVDVFSALRGTHFASRRTILREPKGHGWNDNLVLAPNGRLVMSISANCDHCRTRSRFSGAIVSLRTDGSDLRVYARHLRAGYGLAFVRGPAPCSRR